MRNIIGKEFECDKTTEGEILCLVHYAHPSATEFFDDSIVRDGTPDHTCGEY
jgi:hypothetical protein